MTMILSWPVWAKLLTAAVAVAGIYYETERTAGADKEQASLS